MERYAVIVTPIVTEKGKFNELLEEAKGLGDGLGREVNLKAVTSAGREMIYLSVDKKNVGFSKASPEDVKAVFPIISDGRYKAHIKGTTEDGRQIVLEVEEAEEVQVDLADKNKSKEALKRLETLVGKEDLKARLDFMASFGLTEKTYPTLFAIFVTLIADIIEFRLGLGLPLIPKPETLFTTYNKKNDGNALLTIVRGIISKRGGTCLEGPMARGKNVAWESMSWLTSCELIRLQWSARTNKGDAIAHESTDNEIKNSMTVDKLSSFLSWFADATKLRIFKREQKSEEGLQFGLDVIKSLSPSLKMVNGPILQALELANKGIGTILLNDELNLGDPNTVSGFLNDLMDGHSPSIYIAGVGEVPINHERLFIGATQNGVGGDYIGTRKQNIATMSRMQTVVMEGSSSILTILRTAQYASSVAEEDLLLIDKVYKEFDKGIASGEYPESCLNVRGFKGAVDSVALGMTVKSAIRVNVVNAVQDNNDRDMLNVVIDSLI